MYILKDWEKLKQRGVGGAAGEYKIINSRSIPGLMKKIS